MLRVAINGYGRIGRIVHRQLLTRFPQEVEVVAINASSDAAMRKYLLKYDTLHGRCDRAVEVEGEDLRIEGKPVRVIREKDPAKCPWKDLKVDVVVEATGKFRTREKAQAHLTAGAKAVIITAPPKDDTPMIVRGVNDDLLKSALPIVSAASCTTNCIAPVIKVLDSWKGIKRGLMCTTHSYTSSQNLLDNATESSKLRIARAAALNIIPSTTGAAKAVGKVFPHLKGKLDGMALRIPIPDVSAAYLVLELNAPASPAEINSKLREASEGELKGILAVEEGLLVSSDYLSDPHSSTVDLDSTNVIDGNLVQILAWYDNEWGYAMRVTEMTLQVGTLLR
ncbi:MAG TPA: type I glyceraldehyde-3-phosphate dehydrogenase [Candidatus Peribacter riflensis]|uniref:Glyceraldehyde-3-phosphate dehydrogenase n=1 Tax=Candidatus Peribacter riflensis TaxID=1735162 RepID=A0A0S1SUP8_9BACT|nr:MAG: glyceraldehyde-3-phosphate dehydrogenase, type I [Candidatus Peribacter riflensis]OGJ82541.1 MAG: type I glyceraldehyde-3-phosphate dehydrogenase [Candidatus Peribacteria bacterium RIFOXYC1_FULL_58_8]ALM10911.1 MAG: glyceraldehyde 3-phosphate dehydrogenase [Candidatus Peribacter riflensis]ALM12014.1 MAG: glyceraldehyde-3-phosphate dehydrogenase [Candidatus Peribacter riflensis]ALM13117.1 MAG: glyceraldehyde 3-phosphate dehydrogenase [Candidatus Peribacter riflensis]